MADVGTRTRNDPTARTRLKSIVGPKGYDAAIGIDLLNDLFEHDRGWRVAVHSECRPHLEHGASVRVSLVGDHSVGKTWLINQFTAASRKDPSQLPTGTDVIKASIGIKVCCRGDPYRVCFLDTAGFNTPISSVTTLGRVLEWTQDDPMWAMNEVLQEAKRQELFMRHLTFEFAQVFVLVLGEITHRDQLEITRLEELARSSCSKKHIIVVHNLKNMTERDLLRVSDTGRTYTQEIAAVLGLMHSQFDVCDEAGSGSVVELRGFCVSDDLVLTRHFFLTQDCGTGDGSNRFVLQRIWRLLQSVVPVHGDVLRDIATITSRCIPRFFQLREYHEVRFHSTIAAFVGGTVSQEGKWSEFRDESRKLDDVKQQLERLREERRIRTENNPERLDEDGYDDLDAEEERLAYLRVRAIADLTKPDSDGMGLLPCTERVCTKPTPLASSVARGTTVDFNVSRSRAIVNGSPMTAYLVHMVVPGLACGELRRLRSELRWGEGLTMECSAPRTPETLTIRFHARVRPMAVKQFETLRDAGRPSGSPSRPAVMLDTYHTPTVDMVGTRPFPHHDQFWQRTAEDDAYVVEASLCTKVENCQTEVCPLLDYSRGILTLVVFAGALAHPDEQINPSDIRTDWYTPDRDDEEQDQRDLDEW